MSHGHWRDVIGEAEEAMRMKLPMELKDRLARRADRIATSGPVVLRHQAEQRAVEFLGNMIEKYVALKNRTLN